MPITLTMGLVRDAQIASINGKLQIRWRGVLKGLMGMGTPEALFAAGYAAVVSAGFSYGVAFPNATGATLDQIIIDSASSPVSNPDKAWVTLIYSEKGPGTPLVTFVLTRRNQLVDSETELLPSDGKPVSITWTDPNDGNNSISDVCRWRYRQPIKSLIATGYASITGGFDLMSAMDSLDQAFGCVNDTDWHGLPAGYWLCMGNTDRTRDFGNSYDIEIEFQTKVNEDWSQYQFLANPQDGKRAPVNPADAVALRALPYAYGEITGDPAAFPGAAFPGKFNGIRRAGLFPTFSFGSLFAF